VKQGESAGPSGQNRDRRERFCFFIPKPFETQLKFFEIILNFEFKNTQQKKTKCRSMSAQKCGYTLR